MLRSTDTANSAVSAYKTRPIRRYGFDTRIGPVSLFPVLKIKKKIPIRARDAGDTSGTAAIMVRPTSDRNPNPFPLSIPSSRACFVAGDWIDRRHPKPAAGNPAVAAWIQASAAWNRSAVPRNLLSSAWIRLSPSPGVSSSAAACLEPPSPPPVASSKTEWPPAGSPPSSLFAAENAVATGRKPKPRLQDLPLPWARFFAYGFWCSRPMRLLELQSPCPACVLRRHRG